MSDLDVTRLITGRVLLEDEAEQRFNEILDDNDYNDEFGWYYVRHSDSREFVGLAKVVSFGMTEAEIGYAIRPGHWRKGHRPTSSRRASQTLPTSDPRTSSSCSTT